MQTPREAAGAKCEKNRNKEPERESPRSRILEHKHNIEDRKMSDAKTLYMQFCYNYTGATVKKLNKSESSDK